MPESALRNAQKKLTIGAPDIKKKDRDAQFVRPTVRRQFLPTYSLRGADV
ncbi:hypothetical protein DM56_4793 [Burkholderia mallei]|nr:hypothetical protein BURPS668_1852 [Burkholderia pseudomallei 668]ABO04263.1 hypothetical protein BMA10247_0811 [Burkholderia mallei NCTC 10247]ACQ95911.1 conserved hypothetical protein [Burkholderia pseudomallei MSHR346]EBA46416.1 hypothetical protein BURPS305_1327 [Burkholderia pseudomallei 305]EEH27559.1 conserved hypothetical protein [Burkholderia pseudomallei Pakistan 9]KGC70717.1 hypothetical protein DM75_4207 [Burkholderia mallei]KGS60750.1 hypothetical protein X990_5772 [Burkholder